MNKIPGIKIIIGMPILFLIFLLFKSRPWDYASLEDHYLKNYQNSKVGIVQKKELSKGCNLYIEFVNPNRRYYSFKKDMASINLGNDCEIFSQISKKDYFQKLPESNKCFVIRNDSILLFNCETDLDFYIEKYKLPIPKGKGWKFKENYKWFKMPYKPIIKYLDQEYYEKHK